MFLLSTVVATYTAGVVCLRRLNLPHSAGSIALAAMLALCIQALVALIVGSYSLRAACGALLALQAVSILAFFAGRSRSSREPATPMPPDAIYRVAVAAIAIVLIATFISALAPVTSWDATVAHIALPDAYVRLGHIALLDGNNYSAYPHLMHALFAVLMQFDGALQSATLLVWAMGVAACAAVAGLGERLHSRGTGIIAASVVATAPIFADQAANPSIDLAYAATLLCALYGIVAWQQDQRIAWLVLAGLAAGAGCGIRHTGYLADGLLVAVTLLVTPRTRVRAAALFASMVALGALPWMLRTALVVGNPLYPFFASRFGGNAPPDVDVSAVGSHSSLQGNDWAHFLSFPWSLTMNPSHYGGWSTSPGALWLVLGVIGVIIGGRIAYVFGAFSGIGLFALFFFQRFARYAFPLLTPMMVVAALPLERLPRIRRLTIAALLFGYAIGIVPALSVTAMRLPVVVGMESRDNYLARRVERFPAMQWAAQNLPSDAVILTLDQRGLYLGHATQTNFEAIKAIVPLNHEQQLKWLRSHGITHLFYPEAYIMESPAFRVTNVLPMLDAWRADRDHFSLVKDFDLVNPRTGKNERVEIYEIRH